MEIGVAIAKPATASTPARNRVLIRVSFRGIALLSNITGRARFLREIHGNGGICTAHPASRDPSGYVRDAELVTTN
jgi:hypothetical protein